MQKELICLALLWVTKVFTLGYDFLQQNDIELRSEAPINPFTWTKLGLNRKYGPIWHIPSERVNWWESLHFQNYIEDPMDLNSIQLCCQEHDICSQQDYIPVHMEKHGLNNTMKQIATTCSCNNKFVNCLRNLKTRSAYNVYNQYILSVPKCFKYSKPIKQCQYYNDSLRCITYFFGNGLERHQWYDMYYSVNANDDGVLGNTSDERSVTGESYWTIINQSRFPVFEYTSQRQSPTFDKHEFEQPQPSYYQLPPQIIEPPVQWIGESHQIIEQPSQFIQ